VNIVSRRHFLKVAALYGVAAGGPDFNGPRDV